MKILNIQSSEILPFKFPYMNKLIVRKYFIKLRVAITSDILYFFHVCSTADFRNAFLKTVRQIIRESVRNMSIPATKPGTTNTGTRAIKF
jgi:hypothetical protein